MIIFSAALLLIKSLGFVLHLLHLVVKIVLSLRAAPFIELQEGQFANMTQ